MKKRTIARLKEKHLISVTPIPKVYIRVTFRKDGSWRWEFGYKSFEYFRDAKPKFKGKHCWSGGQDYCIDRMWVYIREQAYRGNIHELDLVS